MHRNQYFPLQQKLFTVYQCLWADVITIVQNVTLKQYGTFHKTMYIIIIVIIYIYLYVYFQTIDKFTINII